MAILRDNASFSRPANADMIEGYMDGRDLSNPEPGENRSHSYRHGFLNGRDDLAKRPRDFAENLKAIAAEAELLDGVIT